MKTICKELASEGIKSLNKKYMEMYGKPAPPFSIWEDSSIEEYKEELKKLTEVDFDESEIDGKI